MGIYTVREKRIYKNQHLVKKKAKWVSKAELNKRKKKRYYKYGQSECQVERCPLLPVKKAVIKVKKGKPKMVKAAMKKKGFK